MPIPAEPEIAATEAPSNVQEVDWHGGGHGGWVGGCGAFGCGATHGGWGGGGWHGGWGGGYHGGYYGGYHGGYYGGYNDWYPLAAFGAGALVGALVAQPHYYYSEPYYYHRTYYHQSGHYAWCAGRYHPYRCYVTHY
jgi:hypothetical protein